MTQLLEHPCDAACLILVVGLVVSWIVRAIRGDG